MLQADLDSLLLRQAEQRKRDLSNFFLHAPHTVPDESRLPLKENAFSLWNRLKSISY